MASLTQTAAPDVEPLTRAEALDHCRVVDEADYGYVDGLVQKARRYVETGMARQLITAEWELALDEFPAEIEIRLLPVQSIDEIQYVDAAGQLQTLDAADYQVDCRHTSRPARIKPAYGKSWPATRPDTYNAVIVTFTAGYGDDPADVPETIRHGLGLLVAWWFEQREPVNLGNIVNPLPHSLDSLLSLEGWTGGG